LETNKKVIDTTVIVYVDASRLINTGMGFSEATALTAADIDADAKTCRIIKAWKYSGNYRPEIGPPNTREPDSHRQPAAGRLGRSRPHLSIAI
jgi:integrase